MDKKMIVPTMILGLATLAGVAAYISSASAENTNKRDTMIESLSQKLNLDKSQVSSAFDQIKEEKQAERQKQISDNLDKAISDGAITAEQKQKLLDRHTEFKAQMEKQRVDLEQWYKDNGIDTEKLQNYGVGFVGKGGRGHHKMMGGI